MLGRSAGEAEWDARLSEPGSPVCAPDWLTLRERADASARAPDLLELVRAHQLFRKGAQRVGVKSRISCGEIDQIICMREHGLEFGPLGVIEES